MPSLQRSMPLVAVLALIAGLASGAKAQVSAPPGRPAASAPASTRPSATPAAAPSQLPPDSVTHHRLVLPDRTLAFTATAGTIKLHNSAGVEQADIAYVAYRLDGTNAATRPVTFVFNGGPGAASAWLQLGALGPWRLPLENGKIYPSAAPVLIDNADTWLDFTDLVFVDPPGTGYSPAPAAAARKTLYSVKGDIEALAAVVRRWLAANGRLASPKFIVGESYGGFRGPLLAEALATDQGVGISGLVLISPALDLTAMRDPNDPLSWAIRLPSYAAVARERRGPVTRADLADVESYAEGQYVEDFLRGPRDAAAVARMVKQVAAFTGLDPALVKRLGGRINRSTFLRAFDRAQGKVGASYDATITAYDPDPDASYSRWLDPVTPGFEAPLASAMTDLYARRLGWKTDRQYQILNDAVAGAWDWGQAIREINAIPAMKRMLALDPHFRVLVAQGLTDLVVPYFGTKLLLDQIPDYGPPGRIAFKVYGGGHMLYTRDASRQALRRDAKKLIEGK